MKSIDWSAFCPRVDRKPDGAQAIPFGCIAVRSLEADGTFPADRPLLNDAGDDRPAARTCVKINQDDLLIFTGQQSTVVERNRQARADEGGADVTVAVVVIPGGFVLVTRIIGRQPLKEIGHVVLDQARLKFERRDRGGASHDKQADQPLALDRAQVLRQLRMEINDVVVPVRIHLNRKPLHVPPCDSPGIVGNNSVLNKSASIIQMSDAPIAERKEPRTKFTSCAAR